MTRIQRFIGGMTFAYTTLVIVAIAGLWLTPFILNVLGQREFGLWLIAAQLTSYVALLDLGVVVLLPREVAFVVTFVVLFPFMIFPAILEGLQDLVFLGKAQLAAWTLGTTVTVLLLLGGWGLYSLVGGLIVTQFSASLAAIARVVLRFSSALPTGSVGWSWARSRPLVISGLWVSVSQIAQTLLYGSMS